MPLHQAPKHDLPSRCSHAVIPGPLAPPPLPDDPTPSPGGGSWDDSLDLFDPSGAPRTGLSVFIMSFVMLISWVLLQMSTVVLLDSFTKASLVIEHEEEEKATSSKRTKEARSHPPHTHTHSQL